MLNHFILHLPFLIASNTIPNDDLIDFGIRIKTKESSKNTSINELPYHNQVLFKLLNHKKKLQNVLKDYIDISIEEFQKKNYRKNFKAIVFALENIEYDSLKELIKENEISFESNVEGISTNYKINDLVEITSELKKLQNELIKRIEYFLKMNLKFNYEKISSNENSTRDSTNIHTETGIINSLKNYLEYTSDFINYFLHSYVTSVFWNFKGFNEKRNIYYVMKKKLICQEIKELKLLRNRIIAAACIELTNEYRMIDYFSELRFFNNDIVKHLVTKYFSKILILRNIICKRGVEVCTFFEYNELDFIKNEINTGILEKIIKPLRDLELSVIENQRKSFRHEFAKIYLKSSMEFENKYIEECQYYEKSFLENGFEHLLQELENLDFSEAEYLFQSPGTLCLIDSETMKWCLNALKYYIHLHNHKIFRIDYENILRELFVIKHERSLFCNNFTELTEIESAIDEKDFIKSKSYLLGNLNSINQNMNNLSDYFNNLIECLKQEKIINLKRKLKINKK